MYGVLEHEAIATAFSSIAFSGLRSLPPKLEPAFRERRRNRIGAQLASMSASSLGDHERPTDRRRSPRTASPRKMAEEVARGQVRGSHGFTEFTYLPGAFAERADMTRRPQPSLWVNPKDFVVRSSRPPPRFLNEFGNYTHSSDPFDSVVDGEKSEAEISGMMQASRGGCGPGVKGNTLGKGVSVAVSCLACRYTSCPSREAAGRGAGSGRWGSSTRASMALRRTCAPTSGRASSASPRTSTGGCTCIAAESLWCPCALHLCPSLTPVALDPRPAVSSSCASGTRPGTGPRAVAGRVRGRTRTSLRTCSSGSGGRGGPPSCAWCGRSPRGASPCRTWGRYGTPCVGRGSTYAPPCPARSPTASTQSAGRPTPTNAA